MYRKKEYKSFRAKWKHGIKLKTFNIRVRKKIYSTERVVRYDDDDI